MVKSISKYICNQDKGRDNSLLMYWCVVAHRQIQVGLQEVAE